MKRRLSHHRLGSTSLVEMLVLIFVISLAFGLVGTSLSNLSRVDSRFKGLAAERSDLDRLIQRLRSDIHSSQAATLDDTTLSLAKPDGDSVVYALTAGRADRTVGDVTTRYRLPPHCLWVVSDVTIPGVTREANRLLEMIFQSTASSAGEGTEIFATLVAEVNRDARLLLSGVEQ